MKPLRTGHGRLIQLVLALLLPAMVSAQARTGFPSVDSANAARADWARGVRAFNAHDYQTAHREMARAANAWPLQQTYLCRSTSLGCDGIVLDRTGAIVAVQNGVTPSRVMRFVIDASRQHITSATVIDRNIAVADEPTIGTIAKGNFVYVANGQWEKHDDSGVRKSGIPLTAPILLAVPLP